MCFGRDARLRRDAKPGSSEEVLGEALSLSVDQDPDRGPTGGLVDDARDFGEVDFSRVRETQAREESLVDDFLSGLTFLAGLCERENSSNDRGSRWYVLYRSA